MVRFVGVSMRVAVRRFAVAACVLVMLGIFTVGIAAGAEAPPVPDSACASEASFRSTAGDNEASLLIINNTGEVLQALWLDYNGKRVFYQQIQPFTSYVQQATWLTHPWIIANLQGSCYRLVVMTSQQQTVTVNPGDGAPTRTAAPPGGDQSLTPVPRADGPGATLEPGKSDSGFPTLLVAGALAAIAAAVAVFWVWGTYTTQAPWWWPYR